MGAGQTVEWAYPDGKWQWCKECFSTWRTQYGNRGMPMSMFVKHLANPHYASEFAKQLLAHTSLKNAGEDKITVENLAPRVDSLHFFAFALGWPMMPSKVVSFRST